MAADPSTGPTLDEVGEDGVLAAIFPLLQQDSGSGSEDGNPLVLLGPGDDCAVLAAPDGRYVVSTDVIVEGHDFLLSTSGGRDVGAKAAAQNLADVAAMGAVPTGAVVSLVAPGETPLAWVQDLARGLADGTRPWGVTVVGGDLSGGPAVVVSVTVFGDLQGRPAVLRSGARPGDVLALAGTCGLAAAGLAVLRAGLTEAAPEVAGGVAEAVATQRAARPPLAAGPAAAAGGATSMIDLSDGLLRDAGRIARASGARLVVNAAADPLRRLHRRLLAVAETLGSMNPTNPTNPTDPTNQTNPTELAWQWVLGGGEDHGLLASFAPHLPLPAGFEPIGRVEAGRGDVEVAGLDVSTMSIGWDHYAGRAGAQH